MQTPKRRRTFIFLALAALCLSSAAQEKTSSTGPATGLSVDAAALRSLMDQFFTAYERKDLGTVMAAWDPKSPELVAHRQRAQQFFAANSEIHTTYTIRDLRVLGESARLILDLNVRATETATGKATTGLGETVLLIECNSKDGVWKIWHEQDAEDLAAELTAAKSDQERTSLLDSDRALLSPKLAQVLMKNGGALRLQGDYSRAATCYELARATSEQLGDKSGVAAAIRSLGIVQRLQGNYVGALDYYQRTAAIYQELGDKKGIARTLSSIGVAQRALGNYASALENYQKSLALYQSLNDAGDTADVLDYIGIVYAYQGQYALALKYLQDGLESRQGLNDQDGVATSLLNIGDVYGLQGNQVQAMEYFQKSLKLHQDLNDKQGIVILLSSIGDVFSQQNNLSQALQYYERSLALAEEMHDRENTAIALNNIGQAQLLQGNYLATVDYAQRSIKISGEIGLLETLWRAYTTAGKGHRMLQDDVQARQAFEEAVRTIETLRTQIGGGEEQQQSFLEDKMSPYQEMVGLLVDENRPSEALAYTERAKGRVLLDVMESGKIKIT